MLTPLANLSAQVTIDFQVNQPLEQHTVDAGGDQNYDGEASVILGGDPTSTGADGNYSYSWFPAQYLDDPTLANPTVVTLDSPTLFTVSVEADGSLCAKEASVMVDFTVGADKPLQIELKAFPNPFLDQVFIDSEQPVPFLSICDVSGNLIQSISNGILTNGFIDTSDLESGLYFFTFEFTNGTRKTLKLCKTY